MASETLDGVEEQLDQEINNLQNRVASLKRQLKIQATVLISSEVTSRALQYLDPDQSLFYTAQDPVGDRVLERSRIQEAHDQQCLYRICASVTSFKVRDPDPNAVDGGKVLGLRFEVMTKAKFLRPYYVMLNRPYSNSRHLRVHRHTVPTSIPLAALAARYLAPPRASEDNAGDQAAQDLSQFVRTLRRGIVRYHNRMGAVADIRRAVGLALRKEARESQHGAIMDISAVDPEVKQIKIEWDDGRTGRVVVDEDGKVSKAVVLDGRGRDRETSRALLGAGNRIEDLVQTLGQTSKRLSG